jgi:hypothetical protein
LTQVQQCTIVLVQKVGYLLVLMLSELLQVALHLLPVQAGGLRHHLLPDDGGGAVLDPHIQDGGDEIPVMLVAPSPPLPIVREGFAVKTTLRELLLALTVTLLFPFVIALPAAC